MSDPEVEYTAKALEYLLKDITSPYASELDEDILLDDSDLDEPPSEAVEVSLQSLQKTLLEQAKLAREDVADFLELGLQFPDFDPTPSVSRPPRGAIERSWAQLFPLLVKAEVKYSEANREATEKRQRALEEIVGRAEEIADLEADEVKRSWPRLSNFLRELSALSAGEWGKGNYAALRDRYERAVRLFEWRFPASDWLNDTTSSLVQKYEDAAQLNRDQIDMEEHRILDLRPLIDAASVAGTLLPGQEKVFSKRISKAQSVIRQYRLSQDGRKKIQGILLAISLPDANMEQLRYEISSILAAVPHDAPLIEEGRRIRNLLDQRIGDRRSKAESFTDSSAVAESPADAVAGVSEDTSDTSLRER